VRFVGKLKARMVCFQAIDRLQQAHLAAWVMDVYRLA